MRGKQTPKIKTITSIGVHFTFLRFGFDPKGSAYPRSRYSLAPREAVVAVLAWGGGAVRVRKLELLELDDEKDTFFPPSMLFSPASDSSMLECKEKVLA